MFPKHKVWLELSQKKLKYNYRRLRTRLSFATKLFAVVKSNAYGHGLVTFSQLADKLGVNGFCVDSVIEGSKLRKSGIDKPIIVLGVTLPDVLQLALENNLTITVASLKFLEFLKKYSPRLPFHLKI